MEEVVKWYALTNKAHIVYVGKFATFDEADAHAPANLIWLLDEDTAHEWRAELDRHLGDDGYPKQLKYKPYPKGKNK